MGETRFEIARHAATAGAAIANEYFRNDPHADRKADNSIVTEADHAVQRRIIGIIREEFPEDTIVAEEDDATTTIPETGTAWIIDPIDGTDNFARGQPYWAVSVAVVEDGNPIAAANALPVIDDYYVAGPDGVTRNDTPVTATNDTHAPLNAITLFHHWPDDIGPLLTAFNDVFSRVGKLGCGQATLAQVADGTVDAAVMVTTPPPWDTVAGAYMVEQAGGRVTDLHGDPWTPDSTGMIATNGDCHDRVCEIVADAYNPST